jgi:dsRNA-specific ribonuclease
MDTIELKIQSCESIIDYTFNDKCLLCEALQTAGAGTPMYWHGAWTTVPKNTRLAVYGDVVLNMILCRLWYAKDLNKGTITSFLLSILCLPV